MHLSTPVIDTPTLGVATLLELFDGDLVSVGEILASALALLEADLARIEQSAATQDMNVVVEAAHRMKGTSGSIGSQRITALSASVEQGAKRHPHTVDASLLHALGEAFAEFRRDFKAFQRSLATPP